MMAKDRLVCTTCMVFVGDAHLRQRAAFDAVERVLLMKARLYFRYFTQAHWDLEPHSVVGGRHLNIATNVSSF